RRRQRRRCRHRRRSWPSPRPSWSGQRWWSPARRVAGGTERSAGGGTPAWSGRRPIGTAIAMVTGTATATGTVTATVTATAACPTGRARAAGTDPTGNDHRAAARNGLKRAGLIRTIAPLRQRDAIDPTISFVVTTARA